MSRWKIMKSTPRPRPAAPTSILPFPHLPLETIPMLIDRPRPQSNQVLADEPQPVCMSELREPKCEKGFDLELALCFKDTNTLVCCFDNPFKPGDLRCRLKGNSLLKEASNCG